MMINRLLLLAKGEYCKLQTIQIFMSVKDSTFNSAEVAAIDFGII